jgi:hypothetical protein
LFFFFFFFFLIRVTLDILLCGMFLKERERERERCVSMMRAAFYKKFFGGEMCLGLSFCAVKAKKRRKMDGQPSPTPPFEER